MTDQQAVIACLYTLIGFGMRGLWANLARAAPATQGAEEQALLWLELWFWKKQLLTHKEQRHEELCTAPRRKDSRGVERF